MKRPPTAAERIAGVVLAFVLGLACCLLLAHGAACESREAFCALTGHRGPPVVDEEPAQPIAPAAPQAKGARTDCESPIRTVPAGPSDLWT